MAKSEILANTQLYLIKSNEHIFKVLANLGGLILQKQFSKWLYQIEDSTTCTKFLKTIKDNQLIKIQRLGASNIIVLCSPVLSYFGINQKSVKVTASKLKRSALIMEKYLEEGYSGRPAEDLRKRMTHSNACSLLPIGYIETYLLERYISVLTNRNWDTSSLLYEYDLMQKRLDFNRSFQMENNTASLELNKDENECDLYNLSCQNAYISKVSLTQKANGKEAVNVFMDVFNIFNLKPEKMAKLVYDISHTMEVIFADFKNNHFANVYVNIYTYCNNGSRYSEEVYSRLLGRDIFGLDEDRLHSLVQFHFYKDTIGNISVDKIQ